jgi:hypothetical protein
MPRIKHTAAKRSVVMKKLQKAAASAGAIMKGSGGGLIHTGKVKPLFKKASDIKAAKKGIIKQLKRRSFFMYT